MRKTMKYMALILIFVVAQEACNATIRAEQERIGTKTPETTLFHQSEGKTMKMTKTQARQLLDDPFLLQERSCIDLRNSLKAHAPFLTFEQNMGKKRRAYDVSFVKLMTKYGTCPDDVYDQLDRLWVEAKEVNKKIFLRFAPTTVPCGTVSYFAMHQAWESYMHGTKLMVDQ